MSRFQKAELEKRIRSRGTEKEEAIDRRLSRANYEIASSDEFDFVLTNHDVDETVKEVFKIIKSWKLFWNLNSSDEIINQEKIY